MLVTDTFCMLTSVILSAATIIICSNPWLLEWIRVGPQHHGLICKQAC